MTRREAVSQVALVFGGTIIGADLFLSGCANSGAKPTGGLNFSEETIALLDEVGETILPATASSPGAKEVKIGEFMKTIVSDCYEEQQQKAFMAGIGELKSESRKQFGKTFMKISPEQKTELLTRLNTVAIEYDKQRGNKPPHYLTMMKQLSVWGYFTSEPGATKALRYVSAPGKYDSCIPYKKGEHAWAI